MSQNSASNGSHSSIEPKHGGRPGTRAGMRRGNSEDHNFILIGESSGPGLIDNPNALFLNPISLTDSYHRRLMQQEYEARREAVFTEKPGLFKRVLQALSKIIS